MFENLLVPYKDANGNLSLAWTGTNGIIPFSSATKNDLTQNQFSFNLDKTYIATGTGNYSTKDANTGEIKVAFANELSKILYQDVNGNLAVRKDNKQKLDKILEGASKVAGFLSNIWDYIDPSRVATRSGTIPNNGTGQIDETGTDIYLNKYLPKDPNITPPPANQFDFLKFIQSNIYVVAVMLIGLIIVLTPKSDNSKKEQKTESKQNNTILYVVIAVVVVLLVTQTKTTNTVATT